MSLFQYATKRRSPPRGVVHSLTLPHHHPPRRFASTSLRSAALRTLTLMTVGLGFVSCWFGVVGWVWCAPRVRWVCTRWWCGWVPLAVVAFRLRLLLSFLVCRLQPSPSRVSLFPRFARLFRRSHCVRPSLCCSLRSRLAHFVRYRSSRVTGLTARRLACSTFVPRFSLCYARFARCRSSLFAYSTISQARLCHCSLASLFWLATLAFVAGLAGSARSCFSLRSWLARYARLWMAGLRPPSLLAGSVAYGACPRGASLWLRHQKRWRRWRTALNDFACLRSSQ